MTHIKCEKCNRIFLITPLSNKCVCGWSPYTDNSKEGMENDMGKKKKKQTSFKKGKNMIITTNNRNDSWEVDVDTVHECSKVPKEQKILVEFLAKRKIDSLMKKYPSIEWLAYLIGDRENPYTVKDIYIPKQEVTSVTVDNINCPEWNDLSVIGVIHSHHGMGNGFSGTDHEWINQNHNISLCIAKTGIAGQVRFKTPCGALKIIPAIIKIKYPELNFDFEAWLKESSEKIKEKHSAAYKNNIVVNKYSSYNGYNGYNIYRGRYKGITGTWINGVFEPDDVLEDNPTGPKIEKKLSESQMQYCNGVPVKDNKKVWNTNIVQEAVDLCIDEEISLEEALNGKG